jgi:hypothetical protein
MTNDRNSNDRRGGLALILSSILMIVTMSLHPTAHQLFEPGRFEHIALLGAIAHAIAVASVPFAFLGGLALTRRLDDPDHFSLTALVVFGFALVAVMIAAMMSGFVAPEIGRALAGAPEERATWGALFHLSGAINQAFAKAHVLGSSAAIVLWSLAIARGRDLSRGIGIYGAIMGVIVAFALVSGHVRLDVHGFGAIVLAQAIWFVLVGVALMRSRPASVTT